MATVRIPPVLRPRTGGESEVDAAGENVGEVLRALAEAHPDTRDQLLGSDGELNRYVNVYLNDEDVRVLDGLDTAVSEGDTVVILPAMAGGGGAVIWLLRHGDAEQGSGDDDARRLTAKGEEQSRAAGRALAALGVDLDACLSSPKLRALDTARLACEPLALDIEAADELAGGDFDPHGLAAGRGDVLLVGHEPDFSNAIARLTGARADVKKGGLAAIDDDELVALLRPEHLERIAG